MILLGQIFKSVTRPGLTLPSSDVSLNRDASLKKMVIGAVVALMFAPTLQAQSSDAALQVVDLPAADRDARRGEFDNQSSEFVKAPTQSNPDYEDTEFGELLYNEASLPTRLEVLRLLSKETPPMLVFLQAISMGMGIDDVLEAAIRYEPNRRREFAQSAISVLPLLSDSDPYVYGTYQLDDLEREDESEPYSAKEVSERFFEDRDILVPRPDWYEGQVHFYASAAELKALQQGNENVKWYRSRAEGIESERPIFVSLYESDQSVVIDGQDRVEIALAKDPKALVPVVFVYNRLKERAIDQIEQPKTIRGVQKAFIEEQQMATPAPEWQNGEFHIMASMDEVYDVFELPSEEDFEPEQWQRLIAEAEKYQVANTAFLGVMVSGSDEEKISQILREHSAFVQWDDPRTEAGYPYAATSDEALNLKAVLGQGVILNRPDLMAALNALGVGSVPFAFYYIDQSRMKPYRKGPRALLALAQGVGVPIPGFSGGFGPPPDCASPPCNN